MFNRETFAAMGEADVDGGAADFDGDGKLSWTGVLHAADAVAVVHV